MIQNNYLMYYIIILYHLINYTVIYNQIKKKWARKASYTTFQNIKF
jgi:hypothetical protein